MNHRKLVLRSLTDLSDKMGPDAYGYLDPVSILGKPGSEAYSTVINRLLRQELIVGIRTPGGVAFRLNHDRYDDIQNALQPWYMNSRVQWLIGTSLAAGGLV